MDRLFIKDAKLFLNGSFSPANILMEDGRFTAVGKEVPSPEHCQVYNAEGLFVLPGFIDVHTHGAVGVDVNAADRAGLERISSFFAAQGTTRWLASVLTDTPEQTLRCIEAVKSAGELSGAQLLGVHLEGPFLAPQYKGAMPERLLRSGSRRLMEQYLSAAGGCIRYITVSPEVDGVAELIPFLREQGIAVAVGHSGADYEQTMSCINAGAVSSTHTLNGMRLFHHHQPAIMGAVLESDIYCEAICDGLHLHPGAVRLLLKVKGNNRVIAVTDSIMAAGLPDGAYKLGVNDVVVKDGDAQLADGSSRAGSTLTMQRAFRNIVNFTQRGMGDVMPLFTENPARMLGIWDSFGSIEVGKAADAVLLNKAMELRGTVVAGKFAYIKEAEC